MLQSSDEIIYKNCICNYSLILSFIHVTVSCKNSKLANFETLENMFSIFKNSASFSVKSKFPTILL